MGLVEGLTMPEPQRVDGELECVRRGSNLFGADLNLGFQLSVLAFG